MNTQLLSTGRVDTTSIYGLISCFSVGPDRLYRWAWQDAIELTAAITTTTHLLLSPVPRMPGRADDALADTLQTLKQLGLPLGSSDGQKSKDSAVTGTKEWLQANADIIRSVYEAHLSDSLCYSKWMDWHSIHVWPEHCQRVGGLVDSTFALEVAQLTQLGPSDAAHLHELSRMPTSLMDLKNGKLGENLLEKARKLYTMSVIVRGVFYDHLATATGTQIMHHHIRRPLWPQKEDAIPIDKFGISNTQRSLYNILVADAFAESSQSSRVHRWARHAIAVRTLVLGKDVDLRDRDTEAQAQAYAATIAKRVGATGHPEVFDRAIAIAADVGIGALVAASLLPYGHAVEIIGGALGAATSQLPRVKAVQEHILKQVRTTEKSLELLAKAGPGRISVSWSGVRLSDA